MWIWYFDYTTVVGTVNPQDHFPRPCQPRDFGKGSIVCVCNSTYCDSAPRLLTPSTWSSSSSSSSRDSSDEQLNRGLIQIYTSTKTGQRLHKSTAHFNNPGESSGPFGPQTRPTTTQEQSTSTFTHTIYGNDLDSRRRRRTRQPHSRPTRFLDIFNSK